MTEIFIYGAGAHARIVLDALEKQSTYKVVALIDDAKPPGTALDEHTVIGGRDALSVLRERNVTKGFVAIGDAATRKEVSTFLSESGFSLVSIRHPFSSVAKDVELGTGTLILAGAIVDPKVQVGPGAILNIRSSVAHDSKIAPYAHIAPAACVGAYTEIEEGSLIGMGAVILPHRRVGRYATVGAGSVVVNDVASHTIVMGNPAGARRDAR